MEQSKGKQTGISKIEDSTGGPRTSEIRQSVQVEDTSRGMEARDGVLKKVYACSYMCCYVTSLSVHHSYIMRKVSSLHHMHLERVNCVAHGPQLC